MKIPVRINAFYLFYDDFTKLSVNNVSVDKHPSVYNIGFAFYSKTSGALYLREVACVLAGNRSSYIYKPARNDT